MKSLKNRQLLQIIILFIVLPFFINIIIESFGNEDFFGGIKKLFSDPFVFLCNALIIASTLSPGLLMGRFRYFWVAVSSSCWLFLGVTNYILVCNRVLPLTAYDMQLLDTLPFIIKRYLNPFLLATVCLFVVVLLLVVFTMFFRALASPKAKHGLKMSAAFFAAIISLTCGSLEYATRSGALETRFTELSVAFVDNGFAYSFMVSALDNGVEKVDGYSKELMASITEKFVSSDEDSVKTPNIIFVQMESFFNLNALSSVEFSQNPVPNFTKLAEENPSGLLTVPVIGAGTANTEFEIVTGMRIANFGAGEYPYKTILTKSTCESIATNLKSHGYTSHFIHNYRGKFYGRDKVYAKLGYDNFYSLEYMTDYETNENGWAKDKILTRYITECLDSTEGADVITAISVQGHGSYDVADFTKHITVTSCENKDKKSSYEYYANQIYEMDSFLGELTESLSSRDEDIILVVYGDHLPSLGFKNNDLEGRSIYQTDYFIWNNMGLEYDEGDIFAYQLNSKVLEGLNITNGEINACHQSFKNSDKYLFNLQALEYDTLYGKKYVYDGKSPYSISDMKINCRKMKIHEITKKDGEENTYIVVGEGFSEHSYVRVETLIVPITYIDENTIEFKHIHTEPGTPVSIWEKDIGNSEIYLMK